MICRSCGSEKLIEFTGELAVHFREFKNFSKPVVSISPEIWVCLDCGKAALSVPESQLRVLAADKTIPVTFSSAVSDATRI